jgi:hypothetical protein
VIKYAITDPNCFNNNYLKKLNNFADFVLFRDKLALNYEKKAKEFIKYSKDFSYKKMIHQDYF